MDKDTETGGSEVQTSQYNKFRAGEYSQLRSRFYKKYPINYDDDWSFADKLFNKLDTLEFNLKTEELAHQETLKVWRELKEIALAKLKEEPEQGEFTKNIRASLERGDSKRTIIEYLKEVCRRYDWLVKRNAKLRAENKQLVNGQVARKEAGS